MSLCCHFKWRLAARAAHKGTNRACPEVILTFTNPQWRLDPGAVWALQPILEVFRRHANDALPRKLWQEAWNNRKGNPGPAQRVREAMAALTSQAMCLFGSGNIPSGRRGSTRMRRIRISYSTYGRR